MNQFEKDFCYKFLGVIVFFLLNIFKFFYGCNIESYSEKICGVVLEIIVFFVYYNEKFRYCLIRVFVNMSDFSIIVFSMLVIFVVVGNKSK